jgi:hypothetical protein
MYTKICRYVRKVAKKPIQKYVIGLQHSRLVVL